MIPKPVQINHIKDETVKSIEATKGFETKIAEVIQKLRDEWTKRGLNNKAMRLEMEKDAREQLILYVYMEENSAALRIQSWFKSRLTTGSKDIKTNKLKQALH